MPIAAKTAVALIGLVAVVAVAAGLWFGRPASLAHDQAAGVLRCDMPAPAALPASAPAGMVWVPGGTFAFGDAVYPEEQPIRQVTVAGFWMDRTEVSNDAFAAFVKATGHVTVAERPVDPLRHPGLPPDMRLPGAVVFVVPTAADGRGSVTRWWRYIPGANWRHPGGPGTSIEGRGAFPVVAVALEDALAYSRWAGRALPTEAQWEWAARAGQPAAAAQPVQPTAANTWQGLFPVVNAATDGFAGLAPVGCYPPNALGLHDLIGNVWELTADAWTPSHHAAIVGNDPAAPVLRPGAPAQRVIKGGSYLCAPNHCMRYRAGARQPQDDDLAASHLGFRTVLNAAGP